MEHAASGSVLRASRSSNVSSGLPGPPAGGRGKDGRIHNDSSRSMAQRLREKWRHCACTSIAITFCTSPFCVGVLSSNSSPCERRIIGGAGGATTPVVRVRSRSTRPRRRSSTRSWTRSSWSAPRILQLQRESVVALRFFAPFPAFSQKEQLGPFFTFSWRFLLFLTAMATRQSNQNPRAPGQRARGGGWSQHRECRSPKGQC